MSGQHRMVQFQRVENLQNVFCRPLRDVARVWSTGCAESPSGDSIDMTEGCEFRSNVIVFVRCLVSSQQHNRTPASSPIEYFQFNATIDCHKNYAVRGRIATSCSFQCNGIARGTRESAQSRHRKQLYEM